MNLPVLFGLIYLGSEIILRFVRKAPVRRKVVDFVSFAVLWSCIAYGVAAALFFPRFTPGLAFVLGDQARYALVAVFAAGVLLRWWAILTLGRFFSVGVALAEDHRLITTGPYYLIRHPSYTGLLLVCAAFAGSLGNWLAFPALFLPVLAALVWRMHVEETALVRFFGDHYLRYQAHTDRLIPWLV